MEKRKIRSSTVILISSILILSCMQLIKNVDIKAAEPNIETVSSDANIAGIDLNKVVSGNISKTATWSYDPTTKIMTFKTTATDDCVSSVNTKRLLSDYYDDGYNGERPFTDFLSKDSYLQHMGDMEHIVVDEGYICIASDAFSFCSAKDVKLPSTLKQINFGAFEYSGVESVDIPALVKNFPRGIFQYSKLKSIKLHNGLKSIDRYAFEGTPLKEIEIPNTVKYMNSCFCKCGKLRKVKLSNKIKVIDDWMFSDCYSLKNIKIPDSVVTIRDAAFDSSGLRNIVIPKNVKTFALTSIDECSHLKKVIIKSKKIKKFGCDYTSELYSIKAKIIVPKSCLNKYKRMIRKLGKKEGYKPLKKVKIVAGNW